MFLILFRLSSEELTDIDHIALYALSTIAVYERGEVRVNLFEDLEASCQRINSNISDPMWHVQKDIVIRGLTKFFSTMTKWPFKWEMSRTRGHLQARHVSSLIISSNRCESIIAATEMGDDISDAKRICIVRKSRI